MPTHRIRGAAAPVFVACLFVTFAAAQPTASADPAARKTPHRSIPAKTALAAPDKTGSIVKSLAAKEQAPAAKTPDDHAELVPYYLPDASRTRVRACGETWRTKKMAGNVGDETWRDFATKCLTADSSSAGR